MGEADDKMLKAIKHYQESLERHTKTGKSEKLLHAIGKLSLLPIRVWHLEETGVGRTVNGLKKFEGTVGEQARNLVDKWKFMVKDEEDKEEKEQNEHKSIKVEKVDAAPVQESPQTATRETKWDDDKRSYHSSNHSKSRSSHSDSQSRRQCDQSKATNSEDKSHKRHHSKTTDYKSSPSDSEIASKRHKVIKTEVKEKHSKYSDKSSESESDESDSSNQSTSRRAQCESSSARSSSGSSDNSSSDSSESSSSDEDDSDKNHNRKRHSPKDSDSDGYSHKKSNDSRSDKKSKSNGANSEYSKIDDSKKKSKNNHSDSSDADGANLKHKEKLDKDTKQSGSKNDERRSSHHNRRSESSKSKHASEKSREAESKSSSSNSKKSEHRESESVREQDKSRDRGSHRSSTKSSKSEDNKKDDSNKERTLKEKKDDKSETTRKRSREESSSRHSKKGKSSPETKDLRRSHDNLSSSKNDGRGDKHSVKDEKQKESSKQPKDKKTVSETSKDRFSTSAESKSNKIPKKLLDGIDSGSGTSFADVLGMLEAPVYSKSKKKSSANEETIPSSSKKTSSVPREDKTARGSKPVGESASFKTNGEIPNLLKDPAGLDPLDINMSSLLPSITPNYRPLGVTLESSKPMYMDDEAFSRVITAKHQRTKVYSGNKAGFTKVPTLFDLCSRILQDNLDALEYTGGVPYSILKPILEKANPNQLYMLEFHNPYLIEDTDELWQLHCQKEFRNKKREELESWREMYLRCLDEREAKLKALTANIKQSQDKSIPVRQTKLAYVDSVVKPPRNIARKQVKNGLSIDIKKPSQTPTERLNQLAKSGDASKIVVPNPSRSAVERSSSSSSHLKPKKAPLMAKTLSLMKNRFGRR